MASFKGKIEATQSLPQRAHRYADFDNVTVGFGGIEGK